MLSLILSIIAFFAFNYAALYYAPQFLTGAGAASLKKRFIILGVAAVNVGLLFVAYRLGISLGLFNLGAFVVLAIEFMALLKAKFLQAVFQAGMILVHSSSIYIFCTSVYAIYLHKLPYEIFENRDLFCNNIAISFIFALFIFFLVCKLLPSRELILLSSTPVYAAMISVIAVFILLYTCVDFAVLLSHQSYSNAALTTISTVILTFLLFYILLNYSMRSARIVVYKRKSDKLEQTRIEKQRYKETLKDKMIRDGLTSCYNRSFIMERLQRAYEEKTAGFMVLFLDLNGLKYVNDHFGHNEGDHYIINVSRALIRSVREEDFVARIGGDEFLIVIMDISEADAELLAGRITRNIKETDKRTQKYKVGVCMGAVYVDETLLETGITNILRIADQKMRSEKTKYYSRG